MTTSATVRRGLGLIGDYLNWDPRPWDYMGTHPSKHLVLL